ncbi:hypothetical protein H0H87_007123 [Tephrocybe sp. NHM501043]|nr:hypothetical protein H0H87_007123 [Tephrocybe sp. NHM501043]
MKGSVKASSSIIRRAPNGRFTSASPAKLVIEPTMSGTPVSTEDFEAVRASLLELATAVKWISSRLDSLPPVTTAPPAQEPRRNVVAFVPPITTIPTKSVSSAAPLSLRCRFPDVEAAVITAIITHEFKTADLHKLDPMNRDKETAYTFNGSTNQFEVSNRAAKEYKTPFSVIIPLQHYFRILSFHVNNGAVTGVFYQYQAHLLKLIAEYEWFAVFNYHSVFFNRPRAEMAAGDFSNWALPATDLLSEHVYAHRKSTAVKGNKSASAARTTTNSGKVCKKFNEGKCTARLGRPGDVKKYMAEYNACINPSGC